MLIMENLVFNFASVELKQGNNVVILNCPLEVFKSSLLDVFLHSDIEVSFKGRFDFVPLGSVSNDK